MACLFTWNPDHAAVMDFVGPWNSQAGLFLTERLRP